jgi:hypothetical protein
MDFSPIYKSSPKSGESWIGFLHRLSWKNGFENPSTLAEQLTLENPTTPDELGQFLGTKIAADFCYASCLETWHVNLKEPRQMVNLDLRTKPAFCPLCIKSGEPYLRYWDHCCYTVCHKHSIPLIDRCPDCTRSLLWSNLYSWRCRCGLRLSEMHNSQISSSLPHSEVLQAAIVSADIVSGNLSIQTLLENMALMIRPGSLSPARLRFGIESRRTTIPWLAAASVTIVGGRSPEMERASQFLEEKNRALTSGDAQTIENWRRGYRDNFPWRLKPHSNSPQAAAIELYSKASYFEVLPFDCPLSDRTDRLNTLLSCRDLARLLKIRTRDIYRLTELEILIPLNLGVRSSNHWIYDWKSVYQLISSIPMLTNSEIDDDKVPLAELIRSGQLRRYNCDVALVLSAVLQRKISAYGPFEHIYDIKLSRSQVNDFGISYLLHQSDSFSYDSAAAILCVSAGIVSRLVKICYLELCGNSEFSASRAAHISLDSLKRFTSDYILLTTLVAPTGSNSIWLANRLAEFGIDHERMPPGESRPILVYRRTSSLMEALSSIHMRYQSRLSLKAIRDPFTDAT